VAEFAYQPTHCQKSYRVVALRKNLTKEKGNWCCSKTISVTTSISPPSGVECGDVVRWANGRCNQENVIEQLKNGAQAMKMPVGT